MQNNNNSSSRENFLLFLLNKMMQQYKALMDKMSESKPLKIISVVELSAIAGETKFSIQISNKNCVLLLTAAEIIGQNYDLKHFSDYHAEMIRQAAQGRLVQFLNLSEENYPSCKVISKKLDREMQQYLFTIETKGNVRLRRTAEEIFKDKNLLKCMEATDIYDVGFTRGSEVVCRDQLILRTKYENE